MSVAPAGALAATAVSIASLALIHPRWGGTVFTTLLAMLLLIARRGDRIPLGRKLITWNAPFVVPLLLLHGVLNPQYPVTAWWLDMVPIRESGWAFGYDLAMRFLLCSVVAAFWLSVDRDELVEALLSLRLPSRLVMLAMQGVVMGRLVRERVHAIHRAQRARGIPVSASIVQRITSVPALLVPVVVGSFVDAEARVSMLLAHGYGRLEPSTQPARLDRRTVMLTFAALGCLAFALTAESFR